MNMVVMQKDDFSFNPIRIELQKKKIIDRKEEKNPRILPVLLIFDKQLLHLVIVFFQREGLGNNFCLQFFSKANDSINNI